MVAQSKEIDRLNKELADANARLTSRELEFEHIGSIAQASLKVYEVFENAQKAADLYLENVRRITSESVGGVAAQNLNFERMYADMREEDIPEEAIPEEDIQEEHIPGEENPEEDSREEGSAADAEGGET